MATAQTPRNGSTTTTTLNVDQAKGLLNQIIDAQSNRQAAKQRIVYASLEDRIGRVEELLPDRMKGQAKRLVTIAMSYFARDPKLSECPPDDFVRAVTGAAAIGFALDGKLCYCVPYNQKWQLSIDYKAIIAVARRSKIIKDCYGDVICKNDFFEHGRRDGVCYLHHTYDLKQNERGPVIGAYCMVILPDGDWRSEVMNRSELDRIQKRAPSKKGPWLTDEDQMRIKTVIRRALKLYTDDPQFAAVLAADDALDDVEPEETPASPPLGRQPIRRPQQPLDEVSPPAPEFDERAAAEAAQAAAELPDREPGEDTE